MSVKSLKELLRGIQLKDGISPELLVNPIEEITVDSRQAAPDKIFLAIKGVSVDGNQFIEKALAAGAVVIGSHAFRHKRYLQLAQNDRAAWATLCANYFDYNANSYKPKVIAITGTDGKTTTCWLLYQLLQGLGKKVSLLSTVGIFIDGKQQPSLAHTTTPDAYYVFKFLAQASKSEIVIVETTSYGELHKRTFGLQFEIAALTNLADDHLTQHHTLENYALAKKNLLIQGRIKLVNCEMIQHNRQVFETLEEVRVWSGEPLKEFKLESFKKNLPGNYNLQNLALALRILGELEIAANWQKAIDQLTPPPGRVKRLDLPSGISVFVDYAHTPQGLEAVLTAFRTLLPSGAKLHCLFGAEERSYPAKRPKMGRIAVTLADYVYLIPTSPGDEPLAEINAAIIEGIQASDPSRLRGEFQTRAAGVAAALQQARAGDIIALLGMGHEAYMENGREYTDEELVLSLG
jgi:UDP-N-acetylmuramoyl-L-alanyl-D-glutamate--2,6-diaminopimelate ligase